MINHEAILAAFRARLLTVVVATTGSATLAATATGYTRTTGSFITDGFSVGDEVTPTGFTQTDVGVVAEVAALTLTIDGGRTTQSAGASRTLAVNLPALRGWDNVAVEPVAGRPYIEEELAPATAELRTQQSLGTVEYTGLYVVRWYGLADQTSRSIAKGADAILALFPPGYGWTLSSGQLTVRGDVAPTRSTIQPDEPGWSVTTITVPYRLFTLNPA